MFILETKNLTKEFGGVHAVDKLSINIEKGKITSIIGPNGSGKTTLTNLITGVVFPSHGKIIIAGESFGKILPHEILELGITRTFQEVRLFEQMSVQDNILLVTTEKNVFT